MAKKLESKMAQEKAPLESFIDSSKLIYLASPYTSKSQALTKLRVELVVHAVAGLLKKGAIVFSPIVNSHCVDAYLGTCPELWYSIDTKYMDRCDELWILMLPGWERSVGIKKELEYAVQKGMPIRYVFYQDCIDSDDYPGDV